jgi:hypothetical protein
VVSAYERVLGVGQLGDNVNRRDFFEVVGLVAGHAKIAAELAPASQAMIPARSPQSRLRTAPTLR